MNQELMLLMNCFVIEDGFNDVLVIFGINWGWFRRDRTREEHRIILVSLLEVARIYFRIDLILRWELERVVGSFGLGFVDLKWSHIMGIELSTSATLFDATA